MSKNLSKKINDLMKLDVKKYFSKEELLKLVYAFEKIFEYLLSDDEEITEDDLLYMGECYMPLEKYLYANTKSRLELEEVYFLMHINTLSILIKNKEIIKDDEVWTSGWAKSAKSLIEIRLTENNEIEKKLMSLCYEFLELFDDEYKKEFEDEGWIIH